MEYRFLGASGCKVSALALGTGTFGGKSPLFNAWGNTRKSMTFAGQFPSEPIVACFEARRVHG